MLNIAIYDIRKEDRKKIYEKLLNYSFKKEIDFLIYEFDSAIQLFKSKMNYDYVFIGKIHSEEVIGGLIFNIIKRNVHSRIFVEDSKKNKEITDEIEKKYPVRVVSFIENEIDTLLDGFICSDINNKRLFTVNENGNSKLVNSNNIRYIEAYSKRSYIHYNNDVVLEVLDSISSLEKKLDDKLFYRCHRSVIINLLQIEWYCKTKVRLKCGNMVDVSRRKFKNFENKVLSFNSNVVGYLYKE